MPRRTTPTRHVRFTPKNCANKARYGSKQSAESAAKELLLQNDIELRAYKCPYCGGWHLTTRQPI